MTDSNEREFTPLEYVCMGLIGIKPISGYGIMTFFQDEALSWSASPGTIYPMLKRLEKLGVLEGELELEYETRPRKVYRLSEQGEQVLMRWLREVPGVVPMAEQREMALWRFQFMEGRLRKAEILEWLNNYLDAVRLYDYGRQTFNTLTAQMTHETGQLSLHRQLVSEATMMDLNALRTWIEMARVRVASASYA